MTIRKIIQSLIDTVGANATGEEVWKAADAAMEKLTAINEDGREVGGPEVLAEIEQVINDYDYSDTRNAALGDLYDMAHDCWG